MCTRFVHRGGSVLTGFNFDIDLAVWDHRLVLEPDRFGIGRTGCGMFITACTETATPAPCCMSTAARRGLSGRAAAV